MIKSWAEACAIVTALIKFGGPHGALHWALEETGDGYDIVCHGPYGESET